MKKRKIRFRCILITLLFLFSETVLHNVETDFSLSRGKNPEQSENAVLQFPKRIIQDGIQELPEIQQTVKKESLVNHTVSFRLKKHGNQSNLFAVISRREFIPGSFSTVVLFLTEQPHRWIANYIHESDGKKRH